MKTSAQRLVALEPGQTGRRDAYAFSGDVVVLHAEAHPARRALLEATSIIHDRHFGVGRRGLAVCAAAAGVGVTFFATNLAVALAQSGLRTVLVDANLRNPGVDRLIRPAEPTPGLRQVLEDRLPFEHAVRDDVVPNLSVLYAGGDPTVPEDLLGREAFPTLIQNCLREFSCTVVDAPPANSSFAARRASSVVGYSLLIARRGVSYTNDIAQCTRELTDDGARVIGTVLNG